MDEAPPRLAILVPCYNEEEVLRTTAEKLRRVLEKARSAELVHPESWICFIDDGSSDETWPLIEQLHASHADIRGIGLSRNFGHQNALWCALCEVEADLYVSIDADLQDDEEAMLSMIEQYRQGKDIVYGVRRDRSSDTRFKRMTAQMFYRLLSRLGVKSVYNHADYRLMSRRAVREIRKFRETHIYLRGMVPLVGFPSACVYYDRRPREMGESKYPVLKMLKLAWHSITSFSNFPLRASVILGALVCCCGAALLLWAFVCWLSGDVVTGWFSLIGVMTVLGGMQLLMMGMIGEYIACIFDEVKNRPKYIVREKL